MGCASCSHIDPFPSEVSKYLHCCSKSCLILHILYIRLVGSLDSDADLQNMATKALILVSNRMTAIRNVEGVVLSRSWISSQASIYSAQLLPFAVVSPSSLARRLVSDAVHHTGKHSGLVNTDRHFKQAPNSFLFQVNFHLYWSC